MLRPGRARVKDRGAWSGGPRLTLWRRAC